MYGLLCVGKGTGTERQIQLSARISQKRDRFYSAVSALCCSMTAVQSQMRDGFNSAARELCFLRMRDGFNSAIRELLTPEICVH